MPVCPCACLPVCACVDAHRVQAEKLKKAKAAKPQLSGAARLMANLKVDSSQSAKHLNQRSLVLVLLRLANPVTYLIQYAMKQLLMNTAQK